MTTIIDAAFEAAVVAEEAVVEWRTPSANSDFRVQRGEPAESLFVWIDDTSSLI